MRNADIRWMAALLLAAALARPTSAAIIDDRFESYAVNSAAALSPPWTVTGNVFATTANQSPIKPIPTDTKGLQFKDNSTPNNPILAQTFGAVASTLYVQFDFRSVIQVENSGFQLRGAGGATIGVNLHMFAFNADVPQHNPSNGGFTNLPVALTDGAWYRYTITASAATDLWSLRIQSLANHAVDATFTGLAFQFALASIDTIRFSFNTGVTNQSGEYSLDNLLVTTNAAELSFDVIPAPTSASAGLALLGVAATMRRRRV